jgi:hypothetical protein
MMPGIKRLESPMRGVFAVGLAWLLLLPAGAQAAGRKTGANVVIEMRGAAGEINGELVGARKDAVVIGLENGESRTVAVADISRIRVLRKSAAVSGLIIGGIAGGIGGVAFSAAKSEQGDDVLDTILAAAAVGSAGALLGGGLGALIGGQFGGDRNYDLTKMSGAQVEDLMRALRKKARVPDYQ